MIRLALLTLAALFLAYLVAAYRATQRWDRAGVARLGPWEPWEPYRDAYQRDPMAWPWGDV